MSDRVIGGRAVLLRCDATDAGGIGHLVRCIAITQAVKGTSVREVHLSGEISAALARSMVSDSDIHLHDAAPDSASLMRLARTVGAEVVHVDHYEGYGDLRQVGRSGGVLTSTATDERFGRRDADVIVDGSPRTSARYDELYGGAAVALGPPFLALREQFSTPLPPPAEVANPSVLVVMGGTDAAGYASAVAHAVSGIPGVSRVGVVGSAAAPAYRDGAPVERIPQTPDFRQLVAGWDLVITGAGTTVWELAALGVPMGVIGVAENQRDHYETLVAGGFAVGLGFLPLPSQVDATGLAAVVTTPARRRQLAARAHGLVDGQGAARIVDIWRDEIVDRASTSLRMRPAAARDAGRLFAWRNDPHTRRASRSTDPVGWSEHLEWVEDALTRVDRRLFVGIAGGEPIGTARFDLRSERAWEVSVTVAPAMRGEGWSRMLVDAATAALRDDGAAVDRIIAELRVGNAASRAVFSGLGYTCVHTDGEWETWEAIPAALRSGPS